MTESAYEQRVVRLLEEISRTLRFIDTKSVRNAERIIQAIRRPRSGQ